MDVTLFFIVDSEQCLSTLGTKITLIFFHTSSLQLIQESLHMDFLKMCNEGKMANIDLSQFSEFLESLYTYS